MLRILITEANTKNSIAIQKDLSRNKKYYLIGLDQKRLYSLKFITIVMIIFMAI